MNRQAAFENNGQFWKGCLHVHTTRSDGRIPPDELMRIYRKNGYDFIALTDHGRYNRVNFAEDTGMLLIPGMEIGALITEGPDAKPDHGFRCYHTVVIGSDDETNGFAHDDRVDGIHVKGQSDFQKKLDQMHEKKNLTFYCHPEWSATSARYFEDLTGNFAMEIYNTGCALSNDMDTDAAYWDEVLGQGKRLYGVAVDDAHSRDACCGGWVMVKSQERTVNSILEALTSGAFYSSCGPVIHDFYIEDDIVHLVTERASKIRFYSDRHPTTLRMPVEIGNGLVEATANVKDWRYVRAVVVGEDGKLAWTNPIY